MVISANEALYHARYNEADKLAVTGGVEITWPVPYWFVDAGALMMLVLMAAIDEGLAGAFIGHPGPEADLRRGARPAGGRRADRARADRQARRRPGAELTVQVAAAAGGGPDPLAAMVTRG